MGQFPITAGLIQWAPTCALTFLVPEHERRDSHHLHTCERTLSLALAPPQDTPLCISPLTLCYSGPPPLDQDPCCCAQGSSHQPALQPSVLPKLLPPLL